ncbi:MAG TPA: helix-turn-helix transcriptional regulator [Acidimicrobiales bacterium]|nr:helix-turn-helix transcriptional regulator [Acidimicrobiales bacterium]
MPSPLDVTIRVIAPPALAEVPTDEWGMRVADARRSRRLSQLALARACGVSQQTISKVEHGEICPHDKLKLRLAAALDLPPAALFPWPVGAR